MEHRIAFPGFMERCCGFTIPEGGVFFAFFVDYLARFEIHRKLATEVEEEWSFDEERQTITFAGKTRPFLGVWGGRPVVSRPELGRLSVTGSRVQLTTPTGEVQEWQFENFSGDWEHVTFDAEAPAFLFGAPYDFDFRYVELV
jgi:hypothetical protein